MAMTMTDSSLLYIPVYSCGTETLHAYTHLLLGLLLLQGHGRTLCVDMDKGMDGVSEYTLFETLALLILDTKLATLFFWLGRDDVCMAGVFDGDGDW